MRARVFVYACPRAASMSQDPVKPNVGRAGGIMMLSLALSRVLALVRDTAMVAMFGRGDITDAYLLAFQIPDLIFYLVAGGALSSSFIPVFSEYLHTGDEEGAWKLFGAMVSLCSLVLVGLIVVMWIFVEPLTALTAGGASPEVQALAAHMSRILLPAQFAFFIGGLMFGTLYARQRFAAPGLAPNIYNLGIILGAVGLSQFFSPGVIGMAWGATIGAFIGNFFLPLAIMRKLGSPIALSLDWRDPGVGRVFKLMLPVVLGLSLPGVYAMIMKRFGSEYSDGVVTSLDLANKLMQVPLGVFGQSLAIAAFPALAQFVAQKRMDAYREQLAKTLRTVLFITVPISAIMGFLALDIVTVLFQWGRGRESDPSIVAGCLVYFAIGIPFWCMHPVLMRAYFAIHNTVKPIVLGTVTTGVFLGLVFGLQATALRYYALPLAGSISAFFLAGAMLTSIAKDAEGLDIRGVVETALKAVTAVIPAGLVLGIGSWLVPTGEGLQGNALSLVRLVGLGLVAAWTYYGLARVLKMPETDTVNRALAKLSRKRA